MTEDILEKKEQKKYQTIKDIATDMSLSVLSKCFKIII